VVCYGINQNLFFCFLLAARLLNPAVSQDVLHYKRGAQVKRAANRPVPWPLCAVLEVLAQRARVRQAARRPHVLHNRIVIGLESAEDVGGWGNIEDIGRVKCNVLCVGAQVRDVETVPQLLVGVAVLPSGGGQAVWLNHGDRNGLLGDKRAVLQTLEWEALDLAVVTVKAVACLRNAGKILNKKASDALVLGQGACQCLAGVRDKKSVNLRKDGHISWKGKEGGGCYCLRILPHLLRKWAWGFNFSTEPRSD
jgi:hypothetical protein